MIKAQLVRHETSDQGTFGKFTVENMSWFSGELSWENNESNISCIPVGEYECHWEYSPKFKRNTYHVKVPERTVIEIHPANLMGKKSKGLLCQLNGCIALGEKIGVMEGQKSLFISAPAIRKFETLMGGQAFLLGVK
jgi:hypothetical protein